LVNLNSKM